ncbi:type II toxin-antitoxin system RelB/DinJ family antitoxin [Atopobiaceae bacterium 24-176]
MATAQMNVRIDQDLKARGDGALANLGVSPTQAVRWLWEQACTGTLESLMAPKGTPATRTVPVAGPAAASQPSRWKASADEAAALLGSLYGPDPGGLASLSYEQLFELAVEEKATEL